MQNFKDALIDLMKEHGVTLEDIDQYDEYGDSCGTEFYFRSKEGEKLTIADLQTAAEFETEILIDKRRIHFSKGGWWSEFSDDLRDVAGEVLVPIEASDEEIYAIVQNCLSQLSD